MSTWLSHQDTRRSQEHSEAQVWTELEREFLVKQYAAGRRLENIARELGRSLVVVRLELRRFRALRDSVVVDSGRESRSRPYITEDCSQITAWRRGGNSWRTIANRLGRSWTAVAAKAYRMSHPSPVAQWTPAAVDELIRLSQSGLKSTEISKRIPRSAMAVMSKLYSVKKKAEFETRESWTSESAWWKETASGQPGKDT